MLIAQTQPTFSLKPVTLEKQLSSPLSQSFAVPEDSKDALTTTEPSTEGPNTSSSDINFLFRYINFIDFGNRIDDQCWNFVHRQRHYSGRLYIDF